MAKTDEQFDKMFREGLEHHREQPSATAWDKLEGQLVARQAPKKGSAWWAIAAAIPLVLGAAFLFWSSGQEPELEVPLAEAQGINPEVGTNSPVTAPTTVEPEKVVPSTSSVSTSSERAQTGTKPQLLNPAAFIAEVATQNEVVTVSIPVFTAEVVPIASESVPTPATPLAETKSISTLSTNEALAEESGLYRIRIYSDGLQKAAPKDKNLVTELGKTVGQVEGLLGKLDNGFGEIQEKKERLFSSLISKKEGSPEKQ